MYNIDWAWGGGGGGEGGGTIAVITVKEYSPILAIH